MFSRRGRSVDDFSSFHRVQNSVKSSFTRYYSNKAHQSVYRRNMEAVNGVERVCQKSAAKRVGFTVGIEKRT